MKVLLIKDVYKLGRAGEIKKVADGYGRNYLIPQRLAIPATTGSMKLAKSIGEKATEKRAILNKELSSVADVLNGVVLSYAVKAGETGKLYGSVSPQMIIDDLNSKYTFDLDRHQVVMEPIRNLGEYKVPVHLTLDLVPEITVFINREGEEKTIVKPTKKDEEEILVEETIIEVSEENGTEVLVEEILVEEVSEPIADLEETATQEETEE